LTGRWSTDALPYLVLNLVGSVILAVIAAITSNWGFLLMEGVWSIVTAWQLIKRPARNSARADTPDPLSDGVVGDPRRSPA
jgi:hypothetical protein